MKLRDLPRNVIALGVVSLLSDTAGDLISPLLPMFVATLAGGGAQALGWMEGIADALSSLLKLVAGAWSDRARRRKPIVGLGYGLAASSRPLMALATSAWHATLVRSLDRAGKGLRESPRDALLAAGVPEEHRGFAYGVHRAFDHMGAVFGPLLAILLLKGLGTDLRTAFLVAAVPGALSVLVLFVWVREQEFGAAAPSGERPVLARLPPRAARGFLLALALFTLGNASDLFLLLRVREVLSLERSIVALPALWLALHVVKAPSAYVAGGWTDRFGARRLIVAGWIWYAAIYGTLAFASAPWLIATLCIVYGVYHGLTEGAEKALTAAVSEEAERGAAFGWYYLTVGLCTLPASAGFGWLWSRFGSRTAFLTSTALALAAVVALVLARASSEHERAPR